MKKKLIAKYLFAFSFGVFVAVARGFLNIHFYPYYLGLFLGVAFSGVDYLIYAMFLRPKEFMGPQNQQMIRERNLKALAQNVKATAVSGTTKLIFHTVYFQIIFLVLTFWVVTSSGSLLGIGLVLSFSVALLVDQMYDFLEKGNISSWFSELNINLTEKQQKLYVTFLIVLLCIIGFVI